MNNDADIFEIRRQMMEIRGGLKKDVEGIRVHARQLTDWHYYLKSFPWVSVAAAAAIGYVIIPKRPRVVQADAATLAKLARDHQLVLQTEAPAKSQTGILAMLTSTASAILLRFGTSYVTGQLQGMLRSQFGTPGPQPSLAEHANGRHTG